MTERWALRAATAVYGASYALTWLLMALGWCWGVLVALTRDPDDATRGQRAAGLVLLALLFVFGGLDDGPR